MAQRAWTRVCIRSASPLIALADDLLMAPHAIVRGNDTTNRRPNQPALVVQTALQSQSSPTFTWRTHGQVNVDHRSRMSTVATVPYWTRLASS